MFLLPFILLCTACLFWSCGKSGSSSNAINIQGFRLTDMAGNLIGQSGPQDSDWTAMRNLTQAEMALFNFGDTVSLDNTAVSGVGILNPFPNPAFTQQMYIFNFAYHTVVKLVFVNNNLQVLLQKVIRTASGSNTLVVDLSDRKKFPDHSSVRVYYSFSAKDHPNFVVGYGDVRICSSTSVPDCF